MKNKTFKKITAKELEKYNNEFLYCGNWGQREIEPVDVDTANKYIKAIEETRTTETPKAGDILKYTNEHGDFYAFAHIDAIDNDDNTATICEQAYTPFISIINNNIKFSTSGGAWCSLPVDNFKYIGQEKKCFCDWGHCGAEAHGAINFPATVNVWEYKAKGSRFGEYSTEHYKKQHISIQTSEQMEARQSRYKVLGDGMAWETIEAYENYKKLYNGVEFAGYWGENNKVLFTYKEKRHFNQSKEEFDKIKAKKYVILNNGSKYIAKLKKDNKNKIINIYLCNDYIIQFNYTTEEERQKYFTYKYYSEYTEA